MNSLISEREGMSGESTLRAPRPRPTNRFETMTDKTRYCVWSDGSFRRDPAKVRGKAAVKAAKRARR